MKVNLLKIMTWWRNMQLQNVRGADKTSKYMFTLSQISMPFQELFLCLPRSHKLTEETQRDTKGLLDLGCNKKQLQRPCRKEQIRVCSQKICVTSWQYTRVQTGWRQGNYRIRSIHLQYVHQLAVQCSSITCSATFLFSFFRVRLSHIDKQWWVLWALDTDFWNEEVGAILPWVHRNWWQVRTTGHLYPCICHT